MMLFAVSISRLLPDFGFAVAMNRVMPVRIAVALVIVGNFIRDGLLCCAVLKFRIAGTRPVTARARFKNN
jgi:hypothetical protein